MLNIKFLKNGKITSGRLCVTFIVSGCLLFYPLVTIAQNTQAEKQQDVATGVALQDDSVKADAVVDKNKNNDEPIIAARGESVDILPLKQALAAAYSNNPELEAGRKALEATNERVPQALSGALPSATINYEKGRQRTRSSGVPDWSFNDSRTRSLQVTQPIFSGGRTWAAVKTARSEVKAAQARLQQVEQGVLLNTIKAYMDVVRAESVLELSRKNLFVLQKQLEASTQRFQVGEDTKTDVSQSEARVAVAQSRVSESKAAAVAARAVFKRYTGYDAAKLILPADLPELPVDLQAAIEIAQQNNPALLERKYLQDAADYTVNARIGSLLPEIGIRGTMSRQEGVGILGTTEFDQDQLALTVSVPIYHGGRSYSQVREARENYQQRRFQMLDTANEVRQQTIAAWEEMLATKSTIESNRKAIEAAKIALEGVKQEQQYGARTTLDVLDAERELFNAEVDYVTSQRNYVVAVYSLLAVLGRLTASDLDLDVKLYDMHEKLKDVEYQFIGF